MSTKDTVQLLLHVDLAEAVLAEDDVLELLPDQRKRREVLRATDFGAGRTERGRPDDWDVSALAVKAMVQKARDLVKDHAGPVEFYVAGLGALPIWVHLGFELSKWAAVTLLNRRPNGEWDVIALDGVAATDAPYFTKVRGLVADEPSDAVGHVGVFVSSRFPPSRPQIHEFADELGVPLAGLVEINAEGKMLGEANGKTASDELVKLLTQVAGQYPHSSGVIVFIAGPATMAAMAGRAVNPHVVGQTIVPNYEGAGYVQALTLPVAESPRPLLPADDESVHGRAETLTGIIDGLEELRGQLQVEHLPEWLPLPERETFLRRLGALKFEREATGESFELSTAEGHMSLGSGLLEVLRHMPAERALGIASSLLLHEVYHVEQGLLSTTYRDVGRAGVALEQIDFWADAVAMEALARLEIGARFGDRAVVSNAAAKQVGLALDGMAAFDQFETGRPLTPLRERRLRRYLIWGLQLARARTIRSADNLSKLFGERLIVELAPLLSALDTRHDKVVRGETSKTELFVVLDHRLARIQRGSHFQPSAVLQAVREYDYASLAEQMSTVRDQHRPLLVPWVD